MIFSVSWIWDGVGFSAEPHSENGTSTTFNGETGSSNGDLAEAMQKLPTGGLDQTDADAGG